MSWFKHRPKVKEPNRLIPQTTSPMSVKHMEEMKAKVKPTEVKEPKKK